MTVVVVKLGILVGPVVFRHNCNVGRHKVALLDQITGTQMPNPVVCAKHCHGAVGQHVDCYVVNARHVLHSDVGWLVGLVGCTTDWLVGLVG